MPSKPFYNLDPITNETTDVLYSDKQYIEKLFHFIEASIAPPYSISINGGWGSGKTMLMKELQKRFENDNYPVLWFNPWEYERADDITFCFLLELNNFARSILKDKMKEIGIFGISLLFSSVDLTARILTNNKLTFTNISQICDEVKKEFENRYDKENPIEIIKNDLKKLTQTLTKKYKRKPLIVFFDDFAYSGESCHLFWFKPATL